MDSATLEALAKPVSGVLLAAVPKSSVIGWGEVTPLLGTNSMPMSCVSPDATPPFSSNVIEPVPVVMFKMLASVLVAAQSHWPGAAAKFFVNVTVRLCVAPTESTNVNVRGTVVPSVARKSRLPFSCATVVSAAAPCWPRPIRMSPFAPCTLKPVTDSTRSPLASRSNAPARVKNRPVPSETMKKPSP